MKGIRASKRTKKFFRHQAGYVAKNILGDYLVFKNKKHTLIGRIVETEAYFGVDDDAAHSFGGKITPRNAVMYKDGGLIYTYFIYGKFWCFNIVVSRENDPQAVLIRALEPVAGIEIMKKTRGISDLRRLTGGPCRWTMSFSINRNLSGESILSNETFVSRGTTKRAKIVQTKRIGVDYAVNCKDLPLRFYIKDNPFVSKA
ncbi:MAG: DNA-3-methyladenine glycosylase [Candidatus Omnitrophota bacterium]